MLKKLLLTAVCLLLLAISSFGAVPTERYVECGLATGNNDGTTKADAWQSWNDMMDNIAAGDRANVLSTATCTIADGDGNTVSNGSQDSPIIIQGYTTDANDGGVAVIDGNSAATNIILLQNNYYILKDLQMGGSTGDAITYTAAGDFNYIWGIKITSAGDAGIQGVSGGRTNYVFHSEISADNNCFVSYDSTIAFVGNYVHDCDIGISSWDGLLIANNLVKNTRSTGIELDDYEVVFGNTVYNSVGDNISASDNNEERLIIYNNMTEKATDKNIETTAGGSVFFAGYNNANDNGGTGISYGSLQVELKESGVATDQAEAGLDTDTFQPAPALDDKGLSSFGSSIDGHFEPGAVMYEETAGGGGTTTAGGHVLVF